tara:strand:- start:107 stop:343 length:237 start_codon:yes stop_codon:yes gene_type:complete
MKVLIDKINKFGKFYVLILIICIISLVLEFFGHRHGETSYEDFLFFPAIYGFLSCIVIFKIGVSLRAFLMKDEDYYDK